MVRLWLAGCAALLASTATVAHPQGRQQQDQQPIIPSLLPDDGNAGNAAAAESLEAYGAQLLRDPGSSECLLLQQGSTQRDRLLQKPPRFLDVVVSVRPSRRSEPSGPVRSHNDGDEEFIEVVGVSEGAVMQKVNQICLGGFATWIASPEEESQADDVEVIKIIDSGPPKNRIDVVLMGDGYTAAQRDRFVDDMKRLVDDMWTGKTFASYTPLFNVWAIFKPSREDGIGVGGRPKDTAFGLYRDGTELRGISCSKPFTARLTCTKTGAYAYDFPSLIGNDDFYGGLGGEFTISTRSPTSGTVVLRHEMGHNFVSVGEEYDGGYVYSGCNAGHSLDKLPWKHWLTEEHVREEQNVLRVQDYSWYDLAKGPYKIPFKSDGKFSRWNLKISASGVESPGSLEVYLDGERLGWNTTGLVDRGFHEWSFENGGLSAGEHLLEFRQGFPSKTGSPIRQLCSVTLHEYQAEPHYHFDNNFYGAFPTYALNGKKSYRPTHEGCLMRNMTQETFCNVCKEGLFLNLLRKISVIDGIRTECLPEKGLRATVDVLALAHLRPQPIAGERYDITWKKNGQPQPALQDLQTIEVDAASAAGKWTVSVAFVTPEIRDDPFGLTRDERVVSWAAC
ncbi:IgA peptidase M64-domain-containing protein [Zopfochytrium polystomum]|nr:IgA peptidase M64-domain-containing protein [Zopfochytrium polystomum]